MSGNPYQPKLVFVGEPFAGRVCELMLDKIAVGRGEHNTLVIQHPSVSHAHCEILAFGPEVIVRDLHSSNGTFVQGVRINPQTQLKHGQVVRFGDVTARLELAPPDFERTTLDETAIHEHAHVLRDQRRAQSAPKQAAAAMKLEASLPPDGSLGEQTAVLTRTALPAVTMASQVQLVPGKTGVIPRAKRWVIIIAVAAAVLSIVLWLIFGG